MCDLKRFEEKLRGFGVNPQTVENLIQYVLSEKTKEEFEKIPLSFEQHVELSEGETKVVFKKYRTNELEKEFFDYEAHRKNIDVHVVLSGQEVITTVGCQHLLPKSSYDEFLDNQKFSGSLIGTLRTLNAGKFFIIFPGEAHKTGLACAGRSCEVLKAVIKIAV